MIKRNIDRIPYNLSWSEELMVKGNPIQRRLMTEHMSKFDNDYNYLGNVQINFDEFINLEKDKINFFKNKEHIHHENSFYDAKFYPLNDNKINFLKDIFDLDYIKVGVQNLKLGHCIAAHFDTNTKYRSELSAILDDYNNRTIDEIFNIFIMFLEPWIHGQGFMIGRQCHLQWKPGDVISFPWYMEHSTVNSSNIDRNIIYVIGSKLLK